MSLIWNKLREAERRRVPILWERRSSDRSPLPVPLLVYGHTSEGEPFHEPTEASHINVGGGLIALSFAVSHAQRLLLFNRLNDQEQECHVVGQRVQHSDRVATAVRFLSATSDFWPKT